MQVFVTKIPEVLVFEPAVFNDQRGFFYESFNERVWQQKSWSNVHFVQDNHSRSIKGVLRGLHYQIYQPQGKLVRCIVGEIYDVAVDLRNWSKTFGKWVGVHLSAENKRQLWVPEGFAHGFLVLSDVAEVLYKATDYYCLEGERCIAWDDKFLGIQWPLSGSPLLSAKDSVAPSFAEAEKYTLTE